MEQRDSELGKLALDDFLKALELEEIVKQDLENALLLVIQAGDLFDQI